MEKSILDHLYQVLVQPGVVLHHLGHLVVVVLRHQGLHLGKEIESLSFATKIFRNTKLEQNSNGGNISPPTATVQAIAPFSPSKEQPAPKVNPASFQTGISTVGRTCENSLIYLAFPFQ